MASAKSTSNLRGPVEVNSKLHLPVSRFHDRFKSMSKGNRPKSHSVFYEFVSVEIPRVAALSVSDEPRGLLGILVVTFRIRVSATWDERVRFPLECSRF